MRRLRLSIVKSVKRMRARRAAADGEDEVASLLTARWGFRRKGAVMLPFLQRGTISSGRPKRARGVVRQFTRLIGQRGRSDMSHSGLVGAMPSWARSGGARRLRRTALQLPRIRRRCHGAAADSDRPGMEVGA